MPEYKTKETPIDTKPYIVYTDDKNIVYSGDPDSDIPGGGSASTAQIIVVPTLDDVFAPSAVTVKDENGSVVQLTVTEIEPSSNALAFDGSVGHYYTIEGEYPVIEVASEADDTGWGFIVNNEGGPIPKPLVFVVPSVGGFLEFTMEDKM